MIKALTLTQPWASLVAIGAKRIETRPWATKYRGRLAIHAAKGFPKWARDLACSPRFGYPLLRDTNLETLPDDLPTGQIVATCNLVSCEKVTSANWREIQGWMIGESIWPLTEMEHDFGDYTFGRYAWLLDDVQPLDKPIPAKGYQRLWDWDETQTQEENHGK